jgi:hypothetical protein
MLTGIISWTRVAFCSQVADIVVEVDGRATGCHPGTRSYTQMFPRYPNVREGGEQAPVPMALERRRPNVVNGDEMHRVGS